MQSSKHHCGPPALQLLHGVLCAAGLDNKKASPGGTSIVIPIPDGDRQRGGQDRQSEQSCPGEGRVDSVQEQRGWDLGPSGHETQLAQPGLCS